MNLRKKTRRKLKFIKKLNNTKRDNSTVNSSLILPTAEDIEPYLSLFKFWYEIGGSEHIPNQIGGGAHEEWCNFFDNLTPDSKESILFLEPRFSLKTSFSACFALLWAIKYPNTNIFYIRKSFTKATAWLFGVKKIINSEKFNAIFGNSKNWFGSPNTNTAFNFSNTKKVQGSQIGQRNIISVESLFQVYGMESAITGDHCNKGVVIWDDGADENDTISKAEYLKTMRFFENLPPIIQNSNFLIIGTRWGKELYDFIINKLNKDLKEKGLKEYKIIQGTPLKQGIEEKTGKILDITNLPSDEEAYRFKSVQKQELIKNYAEMGRRKWLSNFFQRVLPDDEKIFSTEPTYFKLNEINLNEFVYILSATDPATGKEASDFTSTVVIGIHQTGKVYVLNVFAGKESMSKHTKFLAKIINTYYTKLKDMIIESNTLDTSLSKIILPKLICEELNKLQNNTIFEETTINRVIKLKRTKNTDKNARIESLEVPVSIGLLLFPDREIVKNHDGFKELYSEMDGFTARGAEDKDDALDALQIAYSYAEFYYAKRIRDRQINEFVTFLS